MCEKIIDQQSAANLLSKCENYYMSLTTLIIKDFYDICTLVKEKDVIGGDIVIQYLLWMFKPSDFGQMDPALILWLTKKMIDFNYGESFSAIPIGSERIDWDSVIHNWYTAQI